ncbi:unnamed protein product [Rangifer tarandus platyrhynchus]|uniref:Uncharacterized protein n=1 Tax=Rangifer tarandus platyrhynchus TaxID=3082113 RepID=A0ABN9A945_RANTA|nr:unnamed protein product [Rangifer tarandus platyrhynchus]
MAPTHPLVRDREPGSCTERAGCQGSGGGNVGDSRPGLRDSGRRVRAGRKSARPPKSRAQPPPPSPERAGCHPSRNLPATGPATPSRPCLSLRALGRAGGAGAPQPRGRSRSPGSARSPPPSPGSPPAPAHSFRAGQSWSPPRETPDCPLPQLPVRGRALLGNRSLALLRYDVTQALHRAEANQRGSRKLKSP